MIKTILVPTDGSGHAKKAIDLAADIAEKYGARIVILHVLLRHTSESDIETICRENAVSDTLKKKLDDLKDAFLEIVAASYEAGPLSIPIPDEILTDVGNLILDNARKRVESKGVKDIATEILDGSPADKIVAAAEKEKADMIVMGSRGLGNISGLLMGSVSHKVSHLADCTCVTVK